MTDRTAVDTIKGYFYQFDRSILELLKTKNAKDTVVIEGIEDIDLETATETTAIQCKYYSKSNYNHSVIAEPIRLMLFHFKETKDGKRLPVNYKLYGHFKAGKDKLALPLDVVFLKDHFLTYTKNRIKKCYHEDLGLSDVDLKNFLSRLSIDIDGTEYEKQLTEILDLLQKSFTCDEFDAENFYYNNALKVVKDLAVKPDVNKRRVSKSDFLARINTKQILFNRWYVQYKGKDRYFRGLRRQFFTTLNISPFERFFLIDVSSGPIIRSDIKELLFVISKKWSKLSRREPKPFCPYVYLHGMPAKELIALKMDLQSEEFNTIDGFDFEGAEFNVKSIIKTATYDNQIKLKIINNLAYLGHILGAVAKTKEIYQFYKANIFFNGRSDIKRVDIQIEDLQTIREVI